MIRTLNDWLLVELEPEKKVTASGIIKVAEDPIRMARVLMVGPGKQYPDDKYIPTTIRVGERVAFFIASTQTKQGKQISYDMKENQVLIRETDILMVVEDSIEVSR